MFDQVPISELPNASQLVGTEFVPVVQSGETKKTVSSEFKTTNAADLVSGTVASARLPVAGNQQTSRGACYVPTESGIDLSVSGGISVPVATKTIRGSVKVGDNINVDENGVISTEFTNCAFKMTLFVDNFEYMVNMAAGTIGTPPVLPTGMNAITGLNFIWNTGWVLFKVILNEALSGIEEVVVLVGQQTIPQNTLRNLYYSAGYLSQSGNTRTIRNYCEVPDVNLNPIATKTVRGTVVIGDGIDVDVDGKVSVPVATDEIRGSVIKGDGIDVDEDGVISVPAATSLIRGGVKLGNQLYVGENGLLYVKATGGGFEENQSGVIIAGDGLTITDPNGTVAVVKGNKNNRGILKVGDGIDVDSDNVISVPIASAVTRGSVIAGYGINVNELGVISVNDQNYVPYSKISSGLNVDEDGVITVVVATESTLGIVVPGDNIDITESGIISVPVATTTSPGVVSVGDNISVTEAGSISVEKATDLALGVVKVGSNINVTDGVISVPAATTGSLGVVQAGSGITIDSNGVISISGSFQGTCPFRTSPYGENSFGMELGTINGVLPNGMSPSSTPAYVGTWAEGWVIARVSFGATAVTVQSVDIITDPNIPTNTTEYAYYPIAYLFADAGEKKVNNICAQPVASVCDLAFTS